MEYEQEILHVDATPDENYPIRILEAYRRMCDTRASSTTILMGENETNPLVKQMNDDQEKRAAILDAALAKLKGLVTCSYDPLEKKMVLTQEEQQRVNTLWQTKPLAAAKAARFDEQLAEGHSIALIQLQYKYRCNFHCSHCSISIFRQQERDQARHLDIPTVKRVFDEADIYGLAHMGISGGEPLTFPDFPELVEAIGPDRFHIQLDTNGWLMTPEIAKWVKRLGIDKVQISIDGLDADEHDAFRHKPGSHARCMAAIDAVLDAGLALQVATVVNHERAQSAEFEEFMKLMHSKCAPVSAIYAKPVGEYAKRLDLMCTPQDVAHVKRLLAQYGGYDHSTPGYGRDLGCTAVKRVASITASGEVLPCPWMYWSLGNVFDTPLGDILDKGMQYFGTRSPVCRLSEDPEFNERYTSKVYGLDYLPTVEEVMGEVEE